MEEARTATYFQQVAEGKCQGQRQRQRNVPFESAAEAGGDSENSWCQEQQQPGKTKKQEKKRSAQEAAVLDLTRCRGRKRSMVCRGRRRSCCGHDRAKRQSRWSRRMVRGSCRDATRVSRAHRGLDWNSGSACLKGLMSPYALIEFLCPENCGSYLCPHCSVAHLLSCSCRHDCYARFKEYLPSLECGWWWLRMRERARSHRAGSLTSGSAKVVLSTGGRLEVMRSSGVRTFKQEMWRVRVCVCGALTLRCGPSLRKETNHPAFPVAPKNGDSLRNQLDLQYVQRSSCPTVTLAGTRAL